MPNGVSIKTGEKVYTYLLINIFTLLVPLLFSFDRKVHYYRRWKYLFPSILITAAFFLVWDMIFTSINVWGFNPKYLSGIEIVNLPLEEWLFFITVPYASVFIYDVYKAYVKENLFRRISPFLSGLLILFLLIMAVLFRDRLYTMVTFILLGVYIYILQYILRVRFLGRFYFSYLIILIPFLVVNGILTGSFIEDEVVWYNPTQILNLRIFTIPVEDVFYGMLLILMNVSLYEGFKGRAVHKRRPHRAF